MTTVDLQSSQPATGPLLRKFSLLSFWSSIDQRRMTESLRTNPIMAITTSKPAGRRFELPALDFKFASLTDGTDIPPPPPSPIKEVPTPPQTPPSGENKENGGGKKANGAAAAQGQVKTTTVTEGESQGNGGSNGAAASATGGANRPPSRTAGSIMDDKKAKRASWFRRLRTGETAPKQPSTQWENTRKPQAPQGPPPPMIPELTALEAKIDPQDDGSLGNDLFKNIK